ncbi:hypothetical protein BDFG_00973 [Blastomyces dermatitidis ATCC 26199]|nr:hypothetical protein BDFG_00973 [Blastomyces dermatitidis ATCC 26199]
MISLRGRNNRFLLVMADLRMRSDKIALAIPITIATRRRGKGDSLAIVVMPPLDKSQREKSKKETSAKAEDLGG